MKYNNGQERTFSDGAVLKKGDGANLGATFHSFCCVRDDEEGVGRKCFRFVREGSAPKNWVTPGCATALQSLVASFFRRICLSKLYL